MTALNRVAYVEVANISGSPFPTTRTRRRVSVFVKDKAHKETIYRAALTDLRDGLADYERHWLLAGAARRLHAAGKTKLADQSDAALKQADAFILMYDNRPHVQANFIYDSRRMLGEAIEKAQRALARTE